jgi:ABC-type sugar transport system ATPase subunit
MASVHFEGISHRRPGEFDAVVGLDLDVPDGELVALVGGPGSGAATALRLLAGFEDPAAGTVRIGVRQVAGLAPRDRDVALVLPQHGLYPDRTTADHLRFPLVVGGVGAAACEQRVRTVAERLGLGRLLDRHPGELTPPERQRVAIGRAIARRPAVLLMDEPLAGLDDATRSDVRDEIARCHHDLGITTVALIGDRRDAHLLGHATVVFERGVATADHRSPTPA